MPSLSQMNALVTGSTSGIGLAIARAFASEGANVTINGLGDATAIEQERAAIEADFGVKCRYSGANMMDGAAVTAMVHEAQEAGIFVHRATLLVSLARNNSIGSVLPPTRTTTERSRISRQRT